MLLLYLLDIDNMDMEKTTEGTTENLFNKSNDYYLFLLPQNIHA